MTEVINLIKGVDPLTAVLFTVVVIIGLSQGWLVIKGIQIKKKEKNIVPVQLCLRGRIGSCELIRMQMEKAEEMIEHIRAHALSIYLAERKKILGTKDGLHKDRDYQHYMATLFEVCERVKNDIRYFFRENHLAEMTESEFAMHADKRANLINEKVTKYLDQLYYPESKPDRIALYDVHRDKLMPEVLAGVKTVFSQARIIALDFAEGKYDIKGGFHVPDTR